MMSNDDHNTSSDNRELFVRLLTQNERRIYAYILSVVPNWSDADEILQETNVILWKEFERFVPGSNFVAWAIRVAHFQVLTWRKKVERSRLIFDDAFVQLMAEETQRDESSSQARYQALGQCIEDLNSRSRDLLAKCYVEGATVAKVAETLQRSREAIYKALQRTRLALHKCIERRLAQDDAR